MKKRLILIINAGSTSLKFSLFEFPSKNLLINGNFQCLNTSICNCVLQFKKQKLVCDTPNLGFDHVVDKMFLFINEHLVISNLDQKISLIGHRVVHGGDVFSKSVVIDDQVAKQINKISSLAPLHNIPQLQVIKLCRKFFKNSTNVVTFDTAFHQTIPLKNIVYPIPYRFFHEHKIRRYGFHGTSYRYILQKMQGYLNKKKLNLIVAHLGGGASCCAIKDSLSYATSMGYGPLGGCVMATRSGDLDPTVIKGMMEVENLSFDEVWFLINNSSGLKGIAQIPNGDMRFIEEMCDKNDAQGRLAFDIFVNRVVEFISYYYVLLNGTVDGLIFTAGIGENSKHVPNAILEQLKKPFNLSLKENFSLINPGMKLYTNDDSSMPVYSIATDEELMMALDTNALA